MRSRNGFFGESGFTDLGFNHRSRAFMGFAGGVAVQVDVCGPVVASDDDGRVG